jgi:predicted transcriptional regulator
MKIIRSGDEGNETFQVSPAEKQQLLESIAEADRGEFVDGEQILAELDAAD